MKASVYYIGGVSGAGKTSVAKRLARTTGRPVFSLDRYYGILLKSSIEQELAKAAMALIAMRLVEDLMAADCRCVVEGGWIGPDKAADFRDKYGPAFLPVFCGYSDEHLAERYEHIKADKQHWLSRLQRDIAWPFMVKQTAGSRHVRHACERADFPYLDFTDQRAGTTALLDYFLNHPEYVRRGGQ
jgi:hypothetical protein